MIKVGLNIGNSKISCAVIEIKDNNNIKLLSEVRSLINESEKKSHTKINSINLNIPTVESISKYYDSEINNINSEITELDIKKAINSSDYFAVKEDYFEILNNIYGYILDNNLLFNSPVGNYANYLKILFYKILIPYKTLSSYKNIIVTMNQL